MNKFLQKWARIIHRYMGFTLIAIMMIYAVSGVALIYRDTGIFHINKHIEKNIGADLKPEQLGAKLHIHNFQADKIENHIIYFKQGTYNQQTGIADYHTKEYPWLIQKMSSLHTTRSKNANAWFGVIFGIALFFFALSSFWMFPVKSKIFKRGIVFFIGGTILAVLLLIF